MRNDVLRYLRCPACGGPFTATGPTVRCPRGHSFDLARQGYVNLLAGRPAPSGDTPPMVTARESFLAGGHYQFIADALASAAGEVAGAGLVVDVGAGTGYHLAAVLDAAPGAVGLALDSSAPAARRAARAHPRAAVAVCDAWGRLPLADGCASLLLNVFAPRNGPDFHRVLRPDGRLLIVTPEPGHLTELVVALGLLSVDPDKPERVAASLGPRFTSTGSTRHERRLHLSRADVRALVGMGPSAWHRAPDDLAIAALPEPVEVTAAVRLTGYRP